MTDGRENTAQARRYYHHVINGGNLAERDVARMVEYLEARDDEIARLRTELVEANMRTISADSQCQEALEQLAAALEARDARVRAEERARVIEEVKSLPRNSLGCFDAMSLDADGAWVHFDHIDALHTEASRDVK